MKVLLAGFKKYATHDSNPSEKMLACFLGRKDVQTLLLEASYEKSRKNLEKAIAKDKPSFILILNMTPFHSQPTMEQYAYNEMDSEQPDENGVIKSKEEIVGNGPKSLATPFDLSSFSQFLVSKETEATISVDGGRFFDNEAYYLALHSGVPSLMIHLPLESQYSLQEGEKLIDAILEIVSKNV